MKRLRKIKINRIEVDFIETPLDLVAVRVKKSSRSNTLKIFSFLVVSVLGLSSIGYALASFSDNESLQDNEFIAGALDFSLTSPSDFSPSPILPGATTTRAISFINNGNLPKYEVYATSSVGALCDYLNLDVNLNGTSSEYNGSLKDFNASGFIFSDPDTWNFTVTLQAGAPVSVQGTTCNFKFIYFGSQVRNDLPFGQGFNDIEEIDNTITAGIWQKVVINKVYYDPDCSHSGSGPEKKYEWIELYNPTASDISLKKWEICDNNACATIDQDVSIPARQYAVITHDASALKYWEIVDGVVTTYTLSGNFEMDDTADMLILHDAQGSNIDQMNWGMPTSTWANYNDNLWQPGVVDAPNGHMLARVPAGFDTDQVSDWHDLSLPNVRVIWPNGGETLYVGATYNLQWTATNPNGSDSDLTIDIWYSKDSGSTWAKITSTSTTENDGVFAWRVPLYINGYYTPSHKARIKVMAYGPENFMVQSWDISDYDFCPPIDWSLLTDEEKAQVEQLLADGTLTEADIINRDTITIEGTTEGSGAVENVTIIDDSITTENAQTTPENITTSTEETATTTEEIINEETATTTEEVVEETVEESQTEEAPVEVNTEETAVEEISEGEELAVVEEPVTEEQPVIQPNEEPAVTPEPEPTNEGASL